MREGSDPVAALGASEDLSVLYRDRFDQRELQFKVAMWRVLCQDFFQRFVDPNDVVLDLGAGTCEFLTWIQARKKYAVDLNPDVLEHARASGAEPVIAASTDLSAIPDGTIDVVFCSNFLEHLPDKPAVLATLRECARVLSARGRLLVLQPNIRYVGARYWDYFDHHTPLTDQSVREAMLLAGLEPTKVIPRFLPYSVKGKFPRWVWLVKAYLRLPPAWVLFGKQLFMVARPRDHAKSG